MTLPLDIFTVSLIIGLAFLFIGVLADGILDGILFDGALPVISVFFISFGLFGLFGKNLAASIPLACATGAVASLILYVAYRVFRKHGDLTPSPLSPYDAIGCQGTVLWWKGDEGEVSFTVRGTTMKLVSTSLEPLSAGDKVEAYEVGVSSRATVVKVQ